MAGGRGLRLLVLWDGEWVQGKGQKTEHSTHKPGQQLGKSKGDALKVVPTCVCALFRRVTAGARQRPRPCSACPAVMTGGGLGEAEDRAEQSSEQRVASERLGGWVRGCSGIMQDLDLVLRLTNSTTGFSLFGRGMSRYTTTGRGRRECLAHCRRPMRCDTGCGFVLVEGGNGNAGCRLVLV